MNRNHLPWDDRDEPGGVLHPGSLGRLAMAWPNLDEDLSVVAVSLVTTATEPSGASWN